MDSFQDLDESFESIFDNPIYIRDRFRFRLLDLPAELMVRICQLAVVKPNIIDATQAAKSEHQARMLRQPPIAQTCRMLRRESLRAFYRDNSFEAFHWARHACIRDWLVAIGADNLRAMQTLTFHCKFDNDFWVNKFDEVGIKVKVERAEDQSRAAGNLHTLIVTFL